MPFNEQSIANILQRKVMSGLDPEEIEACEKSGFNIYFECWSYEAFDAMSDQLTHEAIIEILNYMEEYSCVGDFMCDEIAQRLEFSAYILILLDRFATMAAECFDPWKGFELLHQIYECYSYVSPPKFVVRGNAQKAAAARHTENRAMQRQAFEWYRVHGNTLKNDDAAIEIRKLVPISLRTAQDWVTRFRKLLRPTRTT